MTIWWVASVTPLWKILATPLFLLLLYPTTRILLSANGLSQRSRSLSLTKRIAASGNEMTLARAHNRDAVPLTATVSYLTSADQDIPSDLFCSAGSLASHPSTDFCCDLDIYLQSLCSVISSASKTKRFVRPASSVSPFRLHRDLVTVSHSLHSWNTAIFCEVLNLHWSFNFIRFLKCQILFHKSSSLNLLIPNSTHNHVAYHRLQCIPPLTMLGQIRQRRQKTATDSPSSRTFEPFPTILEPDGPKWA